MGKRIISIEDTVSATSEETRQATTYDLLTQSLDVPGSYTIEDEFERFIEARPQRITNSPLTWWY